METRLKLSTEEPQNTLKPRIRGRPPGFQIEIQTPPNFVLPVDSVRNAI